MSGIPKDVMSAALDAAAIIPFDHTQAEIFEQLADAIADVIMAERERCANIARDWPLAGLQTTNDQSPKSIFTMGAGVQARTIYEVIMNGGEA